MAGFEDRERAFENKFAHDAEMSWKAEARRNRLLGLWAAERMGISGEDAATYAKAVVKADFAEAGDMDVFRKVKDDLEEKGVGVSESDLRAKMDELLRDAKAQLMGEFDG
jgi:hypothetical protein